MDVDNLARVGTLIDRWAATNPDGTPLRAFADLVAMKRATGRGSDELDLERLREAHGELPDDPPRP